MKKKKLILTALLSLPLCGCSSEASLGVIGGADGPTAVLVSDGGVNWVVIVFLLAIFLLGAYFGFRKRKG